MFKILKILVTFRFLKNSQATKRATRGRTAVKILETRSAARKLEVIYFAPLNREWLPEYAPRKFLATSWKDINSEAAAIMAANAPNWAYIEPRNQRR